MPQPKCAGRISFGLTLCSSCAMDAYGSSWPLHPSIKQEEVTMSFVAWVVLGLAAGLIGSWLGKKEGDGTLPDVLLGVVGRHGGGWLFYTLDPSA